MYEKRCIVELVLDMNGDEFNVQVKRLTLKALKFNDCFNRLSYTQSICMYGRMWKSIIAVEKSQSVSTATSGIIPGWIRASPLHSNNKYPIAWNHLASDENSGNNTKQTKANSTRQVSLISRNPLQNCSLYNWKKSYKRSRRIIGRLMIKLYWLVPEVSQLLWELSWKQ